jgi:hypothetical protein
MKIQIRWHWRLATILLLVGLSEILIAMFVPKPLPWTVLIAAPIPLLTVLFVGIPMLNAKKP